MDVFFEMLTQSKDIQRLNDRYEFLREITNKIESEQSTEDKMLLLNRYLSEFNSFVSDCIEFYNRSISCINQHINTIVSEKDKAVEELQETVDKLGRKIMEEKHAHEQQLEFLSKVAASDPDKALKVLSGIHTESVKHRVFVN